LTSDVRDEEIQRIKEEGRKRGGKKTREVR
jgi:hypothetical protein